MDAQAIYIWILLCIEPTIVMLILAGYFWKKVKANGASFNFSIFDGSFSILIVSIILYKTIVATKKYPDPDYDIDFLPLALSLVLIGTSFGVFIGRCYAIIKKESRYSALLILFGAAAGCLIAIIAFIPWYMLLLKIL